MKIKFSIFYFLLFFFHVSSAFAQVRLENVEVRGNRLVEEPTILLQVSSKPGEAFDSTKVEKDVKEIYRTGFFDQVAAKLEQRGNVGTLVFQVLEKPAIRNVLLQGNKEINDETLKEKLSLGARRFLDRSKIAAGIEQAKTYYQSQGLYGTEINFQVDSVEDNQVDLTFNIKEGVKKVIREVVFEGNQTVDSDDLEGAIKTTHYKWWSSWLTGSGIVKQEMLEADVRELNHYYLTHGFLEVRVTDPVIEEIEKDLRVTFKVSEGKVYRLGQLTANGTLLDDDQAKTLEGIESKSGDIFNVDTLRKDTFTISEKFTDIGYAFANVDPDTKPNREEQTVDVNFKIDKGKVITVNRIDITGNKKTSDNVIRRSLKINEREQYSSSKIRRSQELVQRLGYFDEVSITPNPTAEPDAVDLDVAVREGTTGSFSIGAGVSSGEGLIFTSRISESNIFGTGNALTLNVDTGSRNENYVLSFNNPRINDSQLSLGTDLLSVKREFDDFDRKQRGGSINLGYPFELFGPESIDDYRVGLEYELLEVTIDNVDIGAPSLIQKAEGKTTSSSITPSFTRNTIDNPLDPTKGSRQQFSIELAGLGGEEKFWLAQFNTTWYQPIFKTPFGEIVFSQRTRFGWGETFNNEDFPLFKRFFPGGINSVRGFKSRQLGPKDPDGNEFGGNKQLILNFELIFPIVPSINLQGVTFYDVGNAFDDHENMSIGDLRHAVGFGFRWRSPLAPIRIEIGYPLDKKDGEESIVTNFSFGAPL